MMRYDADAHVQAECPAAVGHAPRSCCHSPREPPGRQRRVSTPPVESVTVPLNVASWARTADGIIRIAAIEAALRMRSISSKLSSLSPQNAWTACGIFPGHWPDRANTTPSHPRIATEPYPVKAATLRTHSYNSCVVIQLRPLDADDMVLEVYNELRRLAAAYMRRERPGQTLQATALVHEAYMRLAEAGRPWTDRKHFLAIAARSMRQILVEHARARGAQKRWAGLDRVSLTESLVAARRRMRCCLRSTRRSRASNRLDPEQARIVDLRYFAGLGIEEAAEALGMSPATLKRRWALARAWLFRELSDIPMSTPTALAACARALRTGLRGEARGCRRLARSGRRSTTGSCAKRCCRSSSIMRRRIVSRQAAGRRLAEFMADEQRARAWAGVWHSTRSFASIGRGGHGPGLPCERRATGPAGRAQGALA